MFIERFLHFLHLCFCARARLLQGDLWLTDRALVFKKPKLSLIGPRLFRYSLALPARAEPKSHRTLTTRHTGILLTHSVAGTVDSVSPTTPGSSQESLSVAAESPTQNALHSPHSPHSPQSPALASTPKALSVASSLPITALPGYSLEHVHLIILQAVGSSKRDALLPVVQEVIATHALVREHFPLETDAHRASSAFSASAAAPAAAAAGDKADRKFFGLLPASSPSASIAPVTAAARDAATEVACALTYLAIARFQAVRKIAHCAYPALLPLVSALESKRAAELHRAHATRIRALSQSAACRDVLSAAATEPHSNAELLRAMWAATVAASAAQFAAARKDKKQAQSSSPARLSIDASNNAASSGLSVPSAEAEPAAMDPHDRKALAEADASLRNVVDVARREEMHEDLIRQRERDAEFDNMSQSIALLSSTFSFDALIAHTALRSQ